MGRSSGPGSPVSFQCGECRKGKWRARYGEPLYSHYQNSGRVERVVLTGKTKKRNTCRGMRHGDTLYQYECLDCGHVGYSSHYDIERFGKSKEEKPNEQ